jgi:hypothetical protein
MEAVLWDTPPNRICLGVISLLDGTVVCSYVVQDRRMRHVGSPERSSESVIEDPNDKSCIITRAGMRRK